jgi:aerobic-type carbon monoxide dehydrogenase small subunit (CoxS/CutS family)
MLAIMLGREIQTVHNLMTILDLHRIQIQFVEKFLFQCEPVKIRMI